MNTTKTLIESTFGRIFVSSGDEYKVMCPLCSRKSLWINVSKRVFHCFICDYKGRLEKLAPAFAHKRIMNVKSIEPALFDLHDKSIFPAKFKYVKHRTEFPEGWDYILSRNVDPAKVIWGCFDDISICAPMYENGKVVYWQSRSIYEVIKRKTGNPRKENCLIGKDSVVFRIDCIKEGEPVFLVEGIFDAWVSGGIATLGKHCSKEQALKIALRRPSVVLVCYDPDTWEETDNVHTFVPAATQARRAFARMSNRPIALPIKLQGHDPAALGRSEFIRQVTNEVLSFRDSHYEALLKLSGVPIQLILKWLQGLSS